MSLPSSAVVPGPDGLARCWWATGTASLTRYHDEEWGTRVTDDRALFERLMLEAFQAGLSWQTILDKRDGFFAAFRGWEPAVVAAFGEADRERLLADAGIVRNRSKIEAAIGNADAFLAIVREFGTFDAYVATIAPRPPGTLAASAGRGDIPATTAVSDALSKDLKRRGFRFVGSTIVYAFMQSVGLVDDHLPGCFRYRG